MNFKVFNDSITVFNNGNKVGEILFPLVENDTVNITRTIIDDSIRGQGIGSQMMEILTKELKNRNLKATVTCSYAEKWFYEHPEFKDLLKQ